MSLDKEFIPYKIALALKELGFDESCLGLYHNDKTLYLTQCKSHEQFHGQVCSAPLYQQAFRWFREKYSLFGCIDLHTSTPIHWYIRIDDIIKNDYMYHSEDENLKFDTYEEAELAAIVKLIEIVKKQNLNG